MSEGSGGEQISPDGNWRWDGHNWVPNAPAAPAAPQEPVAPTPYGQPQQPYGQPQAYGQPPSYPQQSSYPQQPQPYGYAQVPQKQSHTLRNVLLILGLVFILFAGGCVAIIGLAANEVDNAIEDIEANDDAPGGVDNPLEITEGEAFEVYGFDYQAGWTVGEDEFSGLTIENLKFENNRDEPDSAVVDITFLTGNEVVAQLDCSSDTAAVGQVVTLSCYSGDEVPAAYDKITISDSY